MDTKQTRKRPDVAERLRDRKGKREKVIKTSLNKRLIEKALMPEIQAWVYTTSRVTNKGSLVFNRLLLYCLNNNIGLPDLSDLTLYLQCFNIGAGRLNKPNVSLDRVWKDFFSEFPRTEKLKGDLQAYTYAAKQYMTNFHNSLVYTFERRQKGYIVRWCQENDVNKEHVYTIRCAVNGWGCRSEVPEDANAFVAQQREILGIKDGENVTYDWIGSNQAAVVRYFYHILCFMERLEDGKRFSLAPISSIKSHYLTIDTKVLYGMMRNAGLVNTTFKVFMDMRDEHFESVFGLKGLCTGKFGYIVETDGVSACFHFKVPKPPDPVKKDLSRAERVIAIDPGRTNLVYGVEELPDGNIRTYRLTRGEYYTSAGMKAFNRKAAKWEADIAEAELTYRQTSPKTSKGDVWDSFLIDYISVYETLWENKTALKWGRERFRVYCLKRRTLDGFFQTMNGDVEPIIAFGAAKFNPNGRGELSAPTTYVSRTCSKHFTTVMVDEYNTTKMCHCCDQRLSPVTRDGRELRGLRWCCSTNCRTFLNRDVNAARNILRCFRSGATRPQSLVRNSGIVTTPVRALKLY